MVVYWILIKPPLNTATVEVMELLRQDHGKLEAVDAILNPNTNMDGLVQQAFIRHVAHGR